MLRLVRRPRGLIPPLCALFVALTGVGGLTIVPPLPRAALWSWIRIERPGRTTGTCARVRQEHSGAYDVHRDTDRGRLFRRVERIVLERGSVHDFQADTADSNEASEGPVMRTPFVGWWPRASAITLLFAALTTGCGDGKNAPVTPKEALSSDVVLTIDLRTPNADDGAVLFDVVGPGVLSVSTYPGLQIDQDQSTTNGVTTATVAIRGNLTSGAIGEVRVPRANIDATYALRMRQVAAGASGGYADRTDLTAYRLSIRR